MEFSGLKVVLVHDWLNGMRGGEKVLEYFCRIFPNAVIYTLHSEPAKVSDTILSHKINNSFIQYIPFKKYLYRWLLPLYPMAVNSFDLKNCDLVISTSHCAVKNINVPVSVPHICYCFSPMRYAWTLNKDYFGEKGLKVFIINKILDYLKKWDFNGAKRVTSFIAVSGTVQERIAQFYGRESTVVYPPTEIIFTPQNNKEDYFLVLSALTPYKKIDIAINVCNQLNLPLKIAGSG
ncbi:MAG: glycosyl transferase group 1, partial [uncultured bacterium]